VERGFKKYAEELALEVRREMSIAAHERLCSFDLAEHLGVPTLKFSELIVRAESGHELTASQRQALEEEVHGLCIPYRKAGRAILYNDRRHPVRQQSDVAHEASHILLGHPLKDINGVTARTKDLEDEAAALSGALLLPRPAAVHVLRRRMSTKDASDHYGISEQMLTWRCNVSGARQIVARTAK
jgi:Zn-dependent peptidase ImmA (M78 family)